MFLKQSHSQGGSHSPGGKPGFAPRHWTLSMISRWPCLGARAVNQEILPLCILHITAPFSVSPQLSKAGQQMLLGSKELYTQKCNSSETGETEMQEEWLSSPCVSSVLSMREEADRAEISFPWHLLRWTPCTYLHISGSAIAPMNLRKWHMVLCSPVQKCSLAGTASLQMWALEPNLTVLPLFLLISQLPVRFFLRLKNPNQPKKKQHQN